MLAELNKIYHVDALNGFKNLPDDSLNCIITSPPYWALRSYLPNDDPNKKYELGQEPYFKDYINNLCEIFIEAKRVLRNDGCLFVNLGDTYYGGGKGSGGLCQLTERKQKTNFGSIEEVTGGKFNNKELSSKSLCNIPFRFAIKMIDECGWIQRNLIIWHKPNKFPESCKDRFTQDFEPILFFTKNKKYQFIQQLEPYSNNSNPNEIYIGQATKDYEASNAQNPSDSKRRILESMKKRGGRNKRCVWSINVKPTRDKHTATYPLELINPLILAGCPENGVVCDPFMGIGSTAIACKNLKRNYIGFELNQNFITIAQERLTNTQQ